MFSLYVPQPVVCEGCSTSATMSLALVISTGAPPPAFVHEQRPQFHTCEVCGAITVMDAPLMVLDLPRTPALYFAPMTDVPPEANKEALDYLLDKVYSGMGSAWRPEYALDMRIVDRRDLLSLWANAAASPVEVRDDAPASRPTTSRRRMFGRRSLPR